MQSPSKLFTAQAARTTIRKIALDGQGVSSPCFVECSVSDRVNYPIGTTFVIKAKLTDRQGTPFIYSYYSWPCYHINETRAEELIKEGKLGFRESARWSAFLENKEDYLIGKKQVI